MELYGGLGGVGLLLCILSSKKVASKVKLSITCLG